MDEERWTDLVDRFTGGPVSATSMFGSPCLRTGRKVFAVWWHREHLVVKPPPDRAQELLTAVRAGGSSPPSG